MAPKSGENKITDEVCQEKERELSLKVSASMDAVVNAPNKGRPSVERHRPEDSLEMIDAIARGVTYKKIASDYGISRETVQGLGIRHQEVIAEIRKFKSSYSFNDLHRARGILNRKMDMMEDDETQITKTNIRDLAQTVAIMGEAHAIASGENKLIIEHRTGPSISDAQEAIMTARQKAQIMIKQKIEEARKQAIDV